MADKEIATEQSYVSMLYARLDELRGRAHARLAEVLREQGGNPQARSERDAAAGRYGDQLARFRSAEHGLCFGRLDLRDGEHRYIGRIGLFDESADYAPLLVDWRAPAARPFYAATAATPGEVHRRRHLRTSGRQVVGVQDEVLDLTAAGPAGEMELTGEAALLASLATGRTGRMGDIVSTIQAEQDRIIRGEHRGVLVVEGGPGTGKTVVALHRAAYLLYTYRRELAARGVLIVGPNPTFLRYIDQVLPSLGETGVLLATVGELFPGVAADRAEAPPVAEVKGRPEMAAVVAAAVRDRQQVPADVREIVVTDAHPSLAYQRERLTLDRATCEQARDRARHTRRPHNQARAVFVRAVLAALARQVADRLGEDPYADDPLGGGDAPGAGTSLLGEGDVAGIARELATDPQVQAALTELWPVLTPQQLLTELYGSAPRLAAAAPQLSEADRKLLHRDPGAGWTAADVPLLDEAAELLGEAGGAAAAGQQRRRRQQVAYAQGALDIARGSRSLDAEDAAQAESLTAADLVDADQLAQRHDQHDTRSAAEQAAADRRWVFGHVIVDEAQDLSGMAWRMLMRRCPSRSMTLVGDPAQASDPASTGSWEQALSPYLGDRWRRERLTVNYRTPAEIMAYAAPVLRAIDPALPAPRSVRRTGVQPRQYQVEPAELADRLLAEVTEAVTEAGAGRTAVIVPGELLATLGPAVTGARDDATVGPDPALLDHPVAVLAPGHAKGLEFDCAVVVEPDRIVRGSPRGWNDLYVALTRATRWLSIVHTGGLRLRRERRGHLGAGGDAELAQDASDVDGGGAG